MLHQHSDKQKTAPLRVNVTERARWPASQSSCWTLQTEPQSSQRGRYLEESPDRALFRTSGVSSGGTGTSGTPESALDSQSETPSFSTLSSLSEPWEHNTETEDSESRSPEVLLECRGTVVLICVNKSLVVYANSQTSHMIKSHDRGHEIASNNITTY